MDVTINLIGNILGPLLWLAVLSVVGWYALRAAFDERRWRAQEADPIVRRRPAAGAASPSSRKHRRGRASTGARRPALERKPVRTAGAR